MSAEVAAIIVSWNTRQMLLECLHGLRRGAGGRCDCIVVDNGSADGSADAVAEQFPDARLIRNDRNLGFGRANNQALGVMQSPFALLLNSDAMVEPGAVDAMLDYMKSHREVGVVGANLRNEDGTPQNSFDNFPTLATELLNKSLLRRLFPSRYRSKAGPFAAPLEVESVIGACLLVRKSALDQVGLFDEDYFFFKEETDLCLRMQRAGWKVVHHPGALVVHRQGQSKRIASAAARIEYDRSNIIFFAKHRGRSCTILFRIGRVVKLLANVLLGFVGLVLTAGGTRSMRRRVGVYAYLLAWHLGGCPDGWGLRDAGPRPDLDG